VPLIIKQKAKFMEHFMKELEAGLKETLKEVEKENNILCRYSMRVQAIRKALEKMRDYNEKNPFASKAEEINYFKNLAPRLYSQLFYFYKIYQVELEKYYAQKQKMELFYRSELAVIYDFYQQHGEFCRYFHFGSTNLDEHYFTKGDWEETVIDDVAVMMGRDYCVGSYWAARVIANQELQKYLEEELYNLQNPQGEKRATKSKRKLKWLAGPTDLIEVCEGFYLTGAFGDATFKEIIEGAEEFYDISLGHFYNTSQEIGRRKKAKAKYCDEMSDAINKKWDEKE
jgi:hypothetical protein